MSPSSGSSSGIRTSPGSRMSPEPQPWAEPQAPPSARQYLPQEQQDNPPFPLASHCAPARPDGGTAPALKCPQPHRKGQEQVGLQSHSPGMLWGRQWVRMQWVRIQQAPLVGGRSPVLGRESEPGALEWVLPGLEMGPGGRGWSGDQEGLCRMSPVKVTHTKLLCMGSWDADL